MSKHFVSQRRLTVLVRLVDKKVFFQLISFRDIFLRPKKGFTKIFVKKRSFYSFARDQKMHFVISISRLELQQNPYRFSKKYYSKAISDKTYLMFFPPTEDINIIYYECIYSYLKTY
jgi:hypothetical protein